ncbi:cysteine desulfurase family protein [Inconstantimicrobium mannanitabidum]|uniref:Cysteine desulfurase n=1 Tax=Inconstantimicrobium mannanitabidum TaxID=1604901 RepID=A0ACB5RCG0_9CLOT|nr:cysteine desulfurase family protein [Clostridium sp. TW13]GKX66933.1 cysteine desulfurase [Clostridium sp. TW13]
MEVYFDNSATTKPYDEVVNEVATAMTEFYANPSSLHKLGMNCEKKLSEAREILASTINCSKDEIFFTSGGSESNNLFLKGLAKEGNHIIVSRFEHPSILRTVEFMEKNGVEVTYLDIDENGQVSVEQIKEQIKKNTVLVSVMFVNNEIGSIQDLALIGKTIKECSNRAKFHVDAVQGYGKIEIDVKSQNIDLLSISAHKIHGPKGVGFCYIRKGINPNPLIHGGGQEKGVRSGTSNLPLVLGMVKATEITIDNMKDSYKKVTELKEYFIQRLEDIENIRINSPIRDNMSPYILNVSFRGLRSEVLLHMLEEMDIYVSTGSACSSKSGKGSHVLLALGLELKDVDSAIRFSFSPFNSKEEVDYVIDSLKKSLTFLRRVKK